MGRDGHRPVSAGLVEKYAVVRAETGEVIVRQVWDDIGAGARFSTYLPVLVRRASHPPRAPLHDAVARPDGSAAAVVALEGDPEGR